MNEYCIRKTKEVMRYYRFIIYHSFLKQSMIYFIYVVLCLFLLSKIWNNIKLLVYLTCGVEVSFIVIAITLGIIIFFIGLFSAQMPGSIRRITNKKSNDILNNMLQNRIIHNNIQKMIFTIEDESTGNGSFKQLENDRYELLQMHYWDVLQTRIESNIEILIRIINNEKINGKDLSCLLKKYIEEIVMPSEKNIMLIFDNSLSDDFKKHIYKFYKDVYSLI